MRLLRCRVPARIVGPPEGQLQARKTSKRELTRGDDWYWFAQPGYDQASGVGVPDVANLLQQLSYYVGW